MKPIAIITELYKVLTSKIMKAHRQLSLLEEAAEYLVQQEKQL